MTPPPRCDGCRRTAASIAATHGTWAEIPKITAGLDITWWTRHRRGWREAHYCDPCAPDGILWPVECAVCLDGPIIVLASGTLPGMPAHPAHPAETHAAKPSCRASAGSSDTMHASSTRTALKLPASYFAPGDTNPSGGPCRSL